MKNSLAVVTNPDRSPKGCALDANLDARVGYESASQFNREYARLFGAPPLRDIKRVRLSS